MREIRGLKNLRLAGLGQIRVRAPLPDLVSLALGGQSVAEQLECAALAQGATRLEFAFERVAGRDVETIFEKVAAKCGAACEEVSVALALGPAGPGDAADGRRRPFLAFPFAGTKALSALSVSVSGPGAEATRPSDILRTCLGAGVKKMKVERVAVQKPRYDSESDEDDEFFELSQSFPQRFPGVFLHTTTRM